MAFHSLSLELLSPHSLPLKNRRRDYPRELLRRGLCETAPGIWVSTEMTATLADKVICPESTRAGERESEGNGWAKRDGGPLEETRVCELLMGHMGLSPFVRTPPTGQPADKETSGRKGCGLYHQVAGWSRVDTRCPIPGNHEIESHKRVLKNAPLGAMASIWMSVTWQEGVPEPHLQGEDCSHDQ